MCFVLGPPARLISRATADGPCPRHARGHRGYDLELVYIRMTLIVRTSEKDWRTLVTLVDTKSRGGVGTSHLPPYREDRSSDRSSIHRHPTAVTKMMSRPGCRS